MFVSVARQTLDMLPCPTRPCKMNRFVMSVRTILGPRLKSFLKKFISESCLRGKADQRLPASKSFTLYGFDVLLIARNSR